MERIQTINTIYRLSQHGKTITVECLGIQIFKSAYGAVPKASRKFDCLLEDMTPFKSDRRRRSRRELWKCPGQRILRYALLYGNVGYDFSAYNDETAKALADFYLKELETDGILACWSERRGKGGMYIKQGDALTWFVELQYLF
jgi:hypothetical protein